LDSIDPLLVSWGADIVKVIVYPSITLSTDLARDRQTLYIPTVIIAPKNRKIVWNLHPSLVVATNLLLGISKSVAPESMKSTL
jgi:hypothetical protein